MMVHPDAQHQQAMATAPGDFLKQRVQHIQTDPLT
jgi:hypothetical protein